MISKEEIIIKNLNQLLDFWIYLRRIAFKNSDEILEQIGLMIYLIQEKIIKKDEEHDFFYAKEKFETVSLEYRNSNNKIQNMNINFKIPTPMVYEEIKEELFNLLETISVLNLYKFLLENSLEDKKLLEEYTYTYLFEMFFTKKEDLKKSNHVLCYSCGKSTLLIKILEYLKKEKLNISLYIKEFSNETINISIITLKILGYKDLERMFFIEEEELPQKKYDLIIADFMFNLTYLYESIFFSGTIRNILENIIITGQKTISILPYSFFRGRVEGNILETILDHKMLKKIYILQENTIKNLNVDIVVLFLEKNRQKTYKYFLSNRENIDKIKLLNKKNKKIKIQQTLENISQESFEIEKNRIYKSFFNNWILNRKNLEELILNEKKEILYTDDRIRMIELKKEYEKVKKRILILEKMLFVSDNIEERKEILKKINENFNEITRILSNIEGK